MREVVNLSNDTVWDMCEEIATNCRKNSETLLEEGKTLRNALLWGIPGGGVPVAYLLSGMLKCGVANHPNEADIFVDDIVDTGETKKHIMEAYGDKPFFALIDQSGIEEKKWYVFPWDATVTMSKQDIVLRQLQAIGEDPHRDGLRGTPSRVVRMWDEIFSGYNKNPEDILNVSFDNDKGYDGIVALRGLQFYSMCEHHLLPFMGKINIGYIPGRKGKVVGISKLARLVEIFSRRAQIQERLTSQIADAIESVLSPQGVAVVVDATHLCMKMRGVKQQGDTVMRTAEMRGTFRSSQALRSEFMESVLS